MLGSTSSRGSRDKKMKTGDMIEIRCEVQQGPFSDERLITFDTLDGPVTGFVNEEYLHEKPDGWRVRAKFLSAEGESVKVRVRGSFLTTNGLATIPRATALAA